MYTFTPKHEKLTEVLLDQKLAKLGDAYVNFLYSLALSKKMNEATGTKVEGRLLADAFKKAGLREYLPSRIDRHKQADASEALIVYVWLHGLMTIQEGLEILESTEDKIEAFTLLLLSAQKKSNI
ncbi:MAG: ribonuclease III family protein [Candidatus Bathyarchaeia archaeon]|jgi:molybdopterin biosynthesis enzyme